MNAYDSMPREREFGWDDEIQQDGSPFHVLPEGDYHFTVKKFERARHSGSEKIPACNKAILTVSVSSAEALRMNWGAVPGATGICHVGIRKWTGSDGKERENNEITEFFDPETVPQLPAEPYQAVQETAAGWTDLPKKTPTPWDMGKF